MPIAEREDLKSYKPVLCLIHGFRVLSCIVILLAHCLLQTEPNQSFNSKCGSSGELTQCMWVMLIIFACPNKSFNLSLLQAKTHHLSFKI